VRQRDPELLKRLGRDGAKVLWRLVREGDEVAARWRAATPRLTGADNWRRLFGTD
jgi:galactofuranosylgalactofuranosylrhamnosyl-N-acetylglucosaminyl-diphospho-decaprenol beta-1,5/1,6-galactofuranosyltransferase